MSTTVLVWNKVNDRTWQAGGLGSFYEIRRYSNDRQQGLGQWSIEDHFTLFRLFPEEPTMNTQYIVSTRDIEIAKARAQNHLDDSVGRVK